MSKLILYQVKMKILDINLSIRKQSYEKLKSIKKWYSITIGKKTNYKDIIDFISDEFIKNKQLGYLNNVENELKECAPWLKFFKIDNNFEPSLSEKIEAIKEYFENNNDKKTTNEIIDLSLSLILDLYPEIDKILDKNRLIRQKIEIEKSMKKKQMEIQQGRVI